MERFVEMFDALTDSLSVDMPGDTSYAHAAAGMGRNRTGVRVSVRLSATASPEGGAALNARLSEERFHSARRALIEAGISPDFFRTEVCDTTLIGIYPEQAFAEKVRIASSITQGARTKMLSVLADSTLSYAQKIRTLKGMEGGRYWRVLSEECLPEMRAFSAQVSVESVADGYEEDDKNVEGVEADTAPDAAGLERGGEIREREQEGEPKLRTSSAEGILHNRMALKSNALGWGLLVANAGVEFGLSEHVTIHAPLYYSGMDYFSERVKFRVLAVQPELRWNFSRMDGFFVGAHTMITYFNLAAGGDYRIQDRSGDTPMLGGGVSVGYRLHFKDNPRWGVEFVLGAGAYRFCYDRFVNEKNGPYVDTRNRTYMGLDNAAVSVFYEFDLGRGDGR